MIQVLGIMNYSFLNRAFFYIKFYVIYIYIFKKSNDYFYSIVGTLKNNYLSILSREPYIPKKTLIELQNIAKSYGFKIIN